MSFHGRLFWCDKKVRIAVFYYKNFEVKYLETVNAYFLDYLFFFKTLVLPPKYDNNFMSEEDKMRTILWYIPKDNDEDIFVSTILDTYKSIMENESVAVIMPKNTKAQINQL